MKQTILLGFIIMLAGCQPEAYDRTTCYWTIALDRVCIERNAKRLNPMAMVKPENTDRYYATADDVAYMMSDHFKRGGTHTELVQLFIDTLEHYDAGNE